MKAISTSAAIVLVLLVLGAGAMFAMSLIGKKLYPFSQVEGVVLKDGRPVAGAEVERRYVEDSRPVTATTRTDGEGRFSFPKVMQRSLLAWLPGEVVIEQTIVIRHEGIEYMAWSLFKRNYLDNSELDGKPIRLICKLEQESQRGGEVFGIAEIDD